MMSARSELFSSAVEELVS